MSQLAEPLWTDPGIKSGISVGELISNVIKEEEKRAQARNELLNILPKFWHARKKTPPGYVSRSGSTVLRAMALQMH